MVTGLELGYSNVNFLVYIVVLLVDTGGSSSVRIIPLILLLINTLPVVIGMVCELVTVDVIVMIFEAITLPKT